MIKRLLYNIYLEVDKRGMLPSVLRKWLGRCVDLIEERGRRSIEADPYRLDPPEWKGTGQYPWTIGIFKEPWHQHWPFIASCQKLGVAYKLLDITGSNWLEIVEAANCDAFLVYPAVELSIWKQMYEERLFIINKILHKMIFPTFEGIWIHESKRRMHYWLEANRILHPNTWVFYDLQQALDFIANVELPIVYKSNLGSGASGVIVFRNRARLRKHIVMCFKRGFTTYQRSPHDREWRHVLLQEYLPDAKEWRMIRLGDSYFGHQKLRRGDFHSGSGQVGWYDPPRELLEFVRDLTDKGHFTSMGVDVFETPRGEYLVNELQTVFGSYLPYQMRVNDKPGRYCWDEATGCWQFEEGEFNTNGSCDLRVATLLTMLARKGGDNIPTTVGIS